MSSYKVKCLMMGDPCIDTWDLIAEHIQCSFTKRYKYTIGCDIGILDVQLPYERVTLSIWDIACSERYRFFRSSFFRGASCAILAFDVTRYASLNPTLFNLITEIYSSLGAIPIVLIGCNADRAEHRQISREEIEQLCEQMAHVVYFEINFNNDDIIRVFETAAEIILARMGHNEEERRIAYEWRKTQLETLTKTLQDMNFHINDREEVEIISYRGLFSINILDGRVSFEPIICTKCKNHNCQYKQHPRTKSLCIVADGGGWSNVEMQNRELLVLAKIFAIAEDNLPTHVLNQMSEIEVCIHHIEETEVLPLNNFNPPEEFHILEANTRTETEPAHGTYVISTHFTPGEAQTLLRNHRIQFLEGRLPYSVYVLLKERYEKIIIPS